MTIENLEAKNNDKNKEFSQKIENLVEEKTKFKAESDLLAVNFQ